MSVYVYVGARVLGDGDGQQSILDVVPQKPLAGLVLETRSPMGSGYTK